jgi:hypothetical protein
MGGLGAMKIAPFADTKGRFYNPTSFQIISAGKDQRIGNFLTLNAAGFITYDNGLFGTPATSPGPGIDEVGDNLCNFHPTKMGTPQ